MKGPVESARQIGTSEVSLGVKTASFHVLKKVASKSNQTLEDVCLTVRKIRMNEDWDLLGELYGCDRDQVCSIFKNTLPKIVPHLSDLIHWPESDSVKYEVPDVFKRCNLDNVQAVLRCLQVNDSKYLISYDPSGAVTCVSEGFPAYISDDEVVAASGYIYTVPENCKIMVADNFGELNCLMGLKNCSVVRLPEMPTRKESPTKEDLDALRNIISLRVHVSKMFKRIEHYQLCVEKSDVPHDLADSVILCAAGLSNL